MGRPTGPVHVEHVSLADFFKNIAKPGPHPSFLDNKKDDKKENDDKKPATDVKTTPAINSNIIEVNFDTFDDIIAANPYLLLSATASWCPKCKELKPVWA